MESKALQESIDFIINEIGKKSPIVVKRIIIGKGEYLDGALMYVNGLVDRNVIDRDILNSLILHTHEDLHSISDIADYLCRRYIPVSDTIVEMDIKKVVEALKNGKTAILIDGVEDFIVADTTGGEHRSIMDPINESAIKGPREGFVENIGINISILRRRIKDKNLSIEKLKLGVRSQSEAAIVYIDDIADKNIIEQLKARISQVDVDTVITGDMLLEYIQDHPYTIFPMGRTTERPDIVEANLLEGRIAVLIEGSPSVLTAPAFFIEFFQGVEDYYQGPVTASFSRLVRLFAVFIVTTLPAIYITLLKFNVELIPISFITPIATSRTGIALTPFMEVLAMSIIIEFLREGGLRLPSKIAQTLSLVGGIIIGEMAVRSKTVSPSTLLIIGVTVVASFVIPNYNMSLIIRLINFPMLVLANLMGIFGIAAGWFFLMIHLTGLDSFGVPYFSLTKRNLKDFAIRAPLWQMNMRPEDIPTKDDKRQKDFREKFGSKEDE